MNLVETNVVHVMVQVRVQYAMATAKLIQKESIIMIQAAMIWIGKHVALVVEVENTMHVGVMDGLMKVLIFKNHLNVAHDTYYSV